MLKFFLSLLLALGCMATSWEEFGVDEKQELFNDWMKQFNRTYTGDEYNKRMTIFLDNAKVIFKHNSKKGITYELGVNEYTDLTSAEFRQRVFGPTGFCLKPEWKKKALKRQQRHRFEELLGLSEKPNAPTSVNWVTKGVVTPVKNQKQCGSCWAFSTTGSIESAGAIKTGKLVSLSEQQLMDCSRSYGNLGCEGGLMDDAFKYVKAEGGLCSEAEYPYTARNGVCKASSCGTKYDPISGYEDVTRDSEASLMEAVAKGPVSVAIEADQTSFQSYRRGVLTGQCGTRLDHGVLVVGYGSENGQDYWLVKNSWGASWGEEGYVKICRKCEKNLRKGECGILMQPSYPVL